MSAEEKKTVIIFDYIDYRKYLHDYYTHMKSTTSYFSHRYFAQKAEIRSPNFLKNVMEGKKNLTKESVLKFANALGLRKKEVEYFENMVFFDQSKTSDKKQYYYDRMKLFSKSVVRATIEEEQIAYFSKWYHCLVRELVVIRDYHDNWMKLGSDLRPRITPAQARKSVELLIKLGLIEKKKDGTYIQTAKNVTAGNKPVDIMVIRNYHKQALENAKKSLDSFPVNDRNCSSLVMSLTEETYKDIAEEIDEFRNRITLIANKSKGSDRVYKLAIQLFPGSSIKKGKK
jgi:uncharacterized protein (TIGR02147 family)